MNEEHSPPTVEQAVRWLEQIIHWKSELPTRPSQQTHIGAHSPGTNRETQLPFGLSQITDNLDDGYQGIRTPKGCDQWLTLMGEWMQTSGKTGAPSQVNPGAWLHSHLTLQLPGWRWDMWDDWEDWALEIRAGRNHVRHHTGNAPYPAGDCPHCPGTLLQQPTNQGLSDEARCNQCHTTYPIDDVPTARQIALRAITDNQVWVTPKQARTIWPTLTHRQLRDWHRAGTLPRRPLHDTHEYPLGQLNQHMIQSTQSGNQCTQRRDTA